MAMSSTFNVRCEGSLEWVQSELSVGALMVTIKHRFQLPADQGISLVMTNGGQEIDIFDDQDLRNVKGEQIIVYRNLLNPMALMIGTEEYSLDKVPLSTSRLVQIAASEVILPDFSVPDFVVGLWDFAKQIRLTNIRLLAGDKLELQAELYKFVSDDVVPLTEHCTLTLVTMERKCRKILELLLGVFQYWKEGLFPQSLTNLKSLRKMAGEMKDESGERLTEIDTTMGKSREFIDKTMEERVAKYKLGKHLKDELEQEKTKLAEEEQTARRRADEHREAEERVNIARAEFESLKPASDAPWIRRFLWEIKKAFSPNVRQKSRAVDETRSRARESVSAKTQADETKKKQEKVVTDATTEHDYVAQAEEYLRTALDAMKKSHLTMRDMHAFWAGMEVAIQELSENDAFVDHMEKATSDPECDIMKVLQSIPFKRQGITYMARFVAIRDISNDCRKGMAKVKKDVDLFLQETPSKQQALEMLRDQNLMRELGAKSTFMEIGVEIKQPVQESGDDYAEARLAFQLAREDPVDGSHVCFGSVQSTD